MSTPAEHSQMTDLASIKTERPMVSSTSPRQTLLHHAAGKMPLDGKKVKAIEAAIESGSPLPPLRVKNGILADGHHRLQAYRNLGRVSAVVIYEDDGTA